MYVCTTSALNKPKLNHVLTFLLGIDIGKYIPYTGVTFFTDICLCVNVTLQAHVQQSLNSRMDCLWNTFSNGVLPFAGQVFVN